MTLEELQAAANNGDIEAMISLGEQCREESTIGSYITAIKWFAMAAQKGSCYAAIKASALCADVAEAYMEISRYGENTFNFWKQTSMHALDAMKDPADPDFERNSALVWKLFEKGILGMAFVQCISGQDEAALEQLKSIGTSEESKFSKEVCLLKGFCISSMVYTMEDAKRALSLFAPVFNDKEYMASVASKSVLEQMILASAAHQFAYIVREGIVEPENPRLADAIIKLAYDSVSEDVAKQAILS